MANTRKKDYDITPTEITAELPRAVAAMVTGALTRGWRVVRGGHGNLILVAPSQGPGRRATIELPRGERSVKSAVFQSWQRKIEKYGTQGGRNGPSEKSDVRGVVDVPLPSDEFKSAPPEAVAASDAEPPSEVALTPAEVTLAPGEMSADSPVKCPDCGSEWPNTRSMGSHRRTHAYAQGTSKTQRQRDALELIIEAASEALGGKLPGHEELAEELARVTAERDQLQARLNKALSALS